MPVVSHVAAGFGEFGEFGEFVFVANCASDLTFVALLTSDISLIYPNWGP